MSVCMRESVGGNIPTCVCMCMRVCALAHERWYTSVLLKHVSLFFFFQSEADSLTQMNVHIVIDSFNGNS